MTTCRVVQSLPQLQLRSEERDHEGVLVKIKSLHSEMCLSRLIIDGEIK